MDPSLDVHSASGSLLLSSPVQSGAANGVGLPPPPSAPAQPAPGIRLKYLALSIFHSFRLGQPGSLPAGGSLNDVFVAVRHSVSGASLTVPAAVLTATLRRSGILCATLRDEVTVRTESGGATALSTADVSDLQSLERVLPPTARKRRADGAPNTPSRSGEAGSSGSGAAQDAGGSKRMIVVAAVLAPSSRAAFESQPWAQQAEGAAACLRLAVDALDAAGLEATVSKRVRAGLMTPAPSLDGSSASGGDTDELTSLVTPTSSSSSSSSDRGSAASPAPGHAAFTYNVEELLCGPSQGHGGATPEGSSSPLRTGDLLLAVDGFATRGCSACEVQEYLSGLAVDEGIVVRVARPAGAVEAAPSSAAASSTESRSVAKVGFTTPPRAASSGSGSSSQLDESRLAGPSAYPQHPAYPHAVAPASVSARSVGSQRSVSSVHGGTAAAAGGTVRRASSFVAAGGSSASVGSGVRGPISRPGSAMGGGPSMPPSSPYGAASLRSDFSDRGRVVIAGGTPLSRTASSASFAVAGGGSGAVPSATRPASAASNAYSAPGSDIDDYLASVIDATVPSAAGGLGSSPEGGGFIPMQRVQPGLASSVSSAGSSPLGAPSALMRPVALAASASPPAQPLGRALSASRIPVLATAAAGNGSFHTPVRARTPTLRSVSPAGASSVSNLSRSVVGAGGISSRSVSRAGSVVSGTATPPVRSITGGGGHRAVTPTARTPAAGTLSRLPRPSPTTGLPSAAAAATPVIGSRIGSKSFGRIAGMPLPSPRVPHTPGASSASQVMLVPAATDARGALLQPMGGAGASTSPRSVASTSSSVARGVVSSASSRSLTSSATGRYVVVQPGGSAGAVTVSLTPVGGARATSATRRSTAASLPGASPAAGSAAAAARPSTTGSTGRSVSSARTPVSGMLQRPAPASSSSLLVSSRSSSRPATSGAAPSSGSHTGRSSSVSSVRSTASAATTPLRRPAATPASASRLGGATPAASAARATTPVSATRPSSSTLRAGSAGPDRGRAAAAGSTTGSPRSVASASTAASLIPARTPVRPATGRATSVSSTSSAAGTPRLIAPPTYPPTSVARAQTPVASGRGATPSSAAVRRGGAASPSPRPSPPTARSAGPSPPSASPRPPSGSRIPVRTPPLQSTSSRVVSASARVDALFAAEGLLDDFGETAPPPVLPTPTAPLSAAAPRVTRSRPSSASSLSRRSAVNRQVAGALDELAVALADMDAAF